MIGIVDLIKLIDSNNIYNFKLKLVEYLKTNNINDVFDSDNTTLFIYAIQQNRPEIIELLITEYKADIHNQSLNIACNKGYSDIIRLLCEHGAIPDKTNIEDIVSKKYSLNMTQFMLEKYPEVDFGKDTILIKVSDDKLLHYLIQKGARFTEDNVGKILINLCNNYNTTKTLIQTLFNAIETLGCNVNDYINLTDSLNNSVLHNICCCKNAVEIIPLLLKYGANINARNHRNQTPIFIACEKDLKLVDIFLENNADIHVNDDDNQNLLFNLINCMHEEDELYKTMDKLTAKGINLDQFDAFDKLTLIMIACNIPDLKLIKYLVNKGSNLHAINSRGFNAAYLIIHEIIKNNNKNKKLVKILSYFAENNCDMSIYPENNKNPPLIEAIIKYLPFRIIEIILNHSDVNETNDDGFTALYYAYANRNLPLIKLLIQKGAKLE